MGDQEPKGRSFEREVADAYRLLGYRVVPNTLLAGKQTDLIAERSVPGAPLVVLAIECKDHTAPIGNEAVLAFVNRVVAHRASNLISSGVLVSSSGFTANARQVADSHPYVSLLAWEELSAAILDVRSRLSELVTSYEHSSPYRHYLPLSTEMLSWSTMASAHSKGTLDDFIGAWRDNPDLDIGAGNSPSSIFVVGDFGAGKTTFLRHFQYDRSKAHLAHQDIRVPLFIPLRTFRDTPDVTALLRASFRDTYSRDLSPDLLWQQLGSGRFYVLLDGFDEIAERSDAARRLDLFYKFLPLLRSPSRTIMTSRPAYFVGRGELEGLLRRLGDQKASITEVTSPVEGGSNLPAGILRRKLIANHREDLPWASGEPGLPDAGVAVFRLLPLDKERIKDLLERYSAELASADRSSDAVMDFITRTYDLSDLASRPLLLTMIVDSVIEGNLDPNETGIQYGASGLYEIYTDAKLHLDLAKGRNQQEGLSVQTRREMAEALASHMYATGALDADLDELLKSVPSEHKELQRVLTKSALSLEEVKTDFATRSFVTIDRNGRCRFVHKTFRGFFLARMLKGRLDHGHPLLEKWLDQDALYFLGGFAPTMPTVGQKLWAKFVRASPDERILRRNMLVAFLFTTSNHEGRSIEDAEVTETNFGLLRFRRSPMTRVAWRTCDVRRLELERLTWREIKFARSRVSHLLAKGCDLEIDVDDSAIEELQLGEGTDAEIDAAASAIGSCELRDASIKLRVDNGQASSVALTRSKAACTGVREAGFGSIRAEASRCTLSGNFTLGGLSANHSVITMDLDQLEDGSLSMTESVGLLSLTDKGAARLRGNPAGLTTDESSVIFLPQRATPLPLSISHCGVFGGIGPIDLSSPRSTPTPWGVVIVGESLPRSADLDLQAEVIRHGNLLLATRAWYADQVSPSGRLSSVHELRVFAEDAIEPGQAVAGKLPGLLKAVRDQFDKTLLDSWPRVSSS